jgi:hypothetical protein
MRIGNNINNLNSYYDGFAKLLEDQSESEKTDDLNTLIINCNTRIAQFTHLLKLEVELKTNFEKLVKGKQTQQLIKTDNNSLQYKMDYIKTYYNNPDNLKGIITEKVDIDDDNKNVELYILTEKQGKDYNYSTHFILYDKDTKVLYYGYTSFIGRDKNGYTYYNVIDKVDDNLEEPYLTLLNDLYFKILNPQPDTTSAQPEPILPQDMAEKISTLDGIKKNVANGLRKLSDIIEAQRTKSSTGGSKKTTYKLNGEKVVLLHKNKKVQRSIYVKGNGKTKYCKIDHQYILLSKLKNKIQ